LVNVKIQENSLLGNGILILLVIIVFFILINLSSRLRKENLNTLVGIHTLYVHLNEGEEIGEESKNELQQLFDGSYPGVQGQKIYSLLSITLNEIDVYLDNQIISGGKVDDKNAEQIKERVNQLFQLYADILTYRDDVLDSFFFFLLLAIILQSLIFIISYRQIFSMRNRMEEREHYLLKLQDMRERERQDLAVYLHNRVLQDMGEIKLTMENENSSEKLQSCIDRIRRITYNLVPVHLENTGLAAAVSELGSQYFQNDACHFELHQFGFKKDDLKGDLRLICFRIIQEALNNVKKYAQASLVKVTLTKLDHRFILLIEDNGIGFNLNNRKAGEEKGGLGLFMISLLAERKKAEVTIESKPGEGTRIRVVFFQEGGGKMNLYLIDDHEMFRQGLANILEKEGLKISGVAESIDLFLKDKSSVDVLLLDLSLEEGLSLDKIPLIKEIKENIKIIALTMHNKPILIQKALTAGVDGYVVKESHISVLIEGIRRVEKGGKFLDPALSESLIGLIVNEKENTHSGDRGFSTLSRREQEVFQLAAEGLKNEQIARKLYISRKTVEDHRFRLMQKLKVNSAGELVELAREMGAV
jgi:DNA-binding NarL/FixJ family response regulator/signal transduction histidine kinase